MAPHNSALPQPATESARDARKAFHCDLCQKGYARSNEYEAHLNSYDHAHRQRIKEMRQRTRAEGFARRPDAGSADSNMMSKMPLPLKEGINGGKWKKVGTFKPIESTSVYNPAVPTSVATTARADFTAGVESDKSGEPLLNDDTGVANAHQKPMFQPIGFNLASTTSSSSPLNPIPSTGQSNTTTPKLSFKPIGINTPNPSPASKVNVTSQAKPTFKPIDITIPNSSSATKPSSTTANHDAEKKADLPPNFDAADPDTWPPFYEPTHAELVALGYDPADPNRAIANGWADRVHRPVQRTQEYWDRVLNMTEIIGEDGCIAYI